MNYSTFGKTMENLKKCRNIQLVTNDERKNCFLSEPSHHATKWFSEKLLATKITKTNVVMKKKQYFRLKPN